MHRQLLGHAVVRSYLSAVGIRFDGADVSAYSLRIIRGRTLGYDESDSFDRSGAMGDTRLKLLRFLVRLAPALPCCVMRGIG